MYGVFTFLYKKITVPVMASLRASGVQLSIPAICTVAKRLGETEREMPGLTPNFNFKSPKVKEPRRGNRDFFLKDSEGLRRRERAGRERARERERNITREAEVCGERE